jgi:hypothetical protein
VQRGAPALQHVPITCKNSHKEPHCPAAEKYKIQFSNILTGIRPVQDLQGEDHNFTAESDWTHHRQHAEALLFTPFTLAASNNAQQAMEMGNVPCAQELSEWTVQKRELPESSLPGDNPRGGEEPSGGGDGGGRQPSQQTGAWKQLTWLKDQVMMAKYMIEEARPFIADPHQLAQNTYDGEPHMTNPRPSSPWVFSLSLMAS